MFTGLMWAKNNNLKLETKDVKGRTHHTFYFYSATGPSYHLLEPQRKPSKGTKLWCTARAGYLHMGSVKSQQICSHTCKYIRVIVGLATWKIQQIPDTRFVPSEIFCFVYQIIEVLVILFVAQENCLWKILVSILG